jgi:hypothetical protein
MPGRHRVAQGECILSITAKYWFSEWKPVWNDAANSELRKKRGEPTILQAGDVVVLPDQPPKTWPVATGTHHRIVVPRVHAALRIQILDIDETPIANAAYELSFGEATLTGETDGEGWLEHQVPATEQDFLLALSMDGGSPSEGARYEWELKAGHLDPIDLPRGISQRLANLGYWPTEHQLARKILPYALRAFQEDHGLEVTGELNDETKDKLKEVHGGC